MFYFHHTLTIFFKSIKIFLLLFLALILYKEQSQAQDKSEVISNWQQYTDASNSLYHHLASQAYLLLARRDSLVSELNTLSDWQERQQQIKKTLHDLVGPFPQKTPLNERIIRKVRKKEYTIEHIVFESQPNFYVISSLFLPHGKKKKAPAILYCIGHTDEGYRDPIYQHVVLNLVKKGFIVLTFDPVGQGERFQYYDVDKGVSKLGGSTHQHSYPGAQAFIGGGSQARYMIWDGIRAIDYLLTRKEVDPARIGITGRSGGGTQAAYIAAFDDRILAAAPENYITNFTRLLQAIGPQDAEQNLYHEILKGIDHPDLLEVRAPKPTLMITTTRDFFSIQGSMETEKEVSKIFEAYGKANHFYRVEADTTHASDQKNRESMYAFFQKYLNNPGDSTDLNVNPLSHELRVAPTGQVATSFKDAESLYDLNLRRADSSSEKLNENRKIAGHLSETLRMAKKLSGYQSPAAYHKPVFMGRFQEKDKVIEKYFVKGEGAYVIPYLLIIPKKPNGKAVISLNPEGKSEEQKSDETSWLLKRGFTLLIPDLLGTGELGKGDYKGDSYMDNASYGVWYLSVLTGRSIVGIRAGDVNRLADLLLKRPDISEIYGLAKETTASTLLYAAAYNPNIKKIFLNRPLSSYLSLVKSQFYDARFIYGAVANSLDYYDLPDLAAALAPRRLTYFNPVNGQNKTIARREQGQELNFIIKTYESKGASDQFMLSTGTEEEKMKLLEKWIQ